MILEGVKLMILGMGIVCIFLLILMVLIQLSSVVFRENATIPKSSVAIGAKTPDHNLVTILSAAITAYRSKKQQDKE